MIGRIYHVGLTVSDLDRSVAFYRDILGLAFQGEIFIDRQIQLTPFLRLVKASKEHFACCFACSNWDAPA